MTGPYREAERDEGEHSIAVFDKWHCPLCELDHYYRDGRVYAACHPGCHASGPHLHARCNACHGRWTMPTSAEHSRRTRERWVQRGKVAAAAVTAVGAASAVGVVALHFAGLL